MYKEKYFSYNHVTFDQHQLIINDGWSTGIAQPIFLSVDVKNNVDISKLFNLLTSNINMDFITSDVS